MRHTFRDKVVSALTLSYLICSGSAAFDSRLTGTWSTKSNAVITGPVSTCAGYIVELTGPQLKPQTKLMVVIVNMQLANGLL